MEQPYYSALRYNSVILSEDAWSPNELLASMDGKKFFLIPFLIKNYTFDVIHVYQVIYIYRCKD